ncbi:Mrp/NBP35 family ATP-binding protein [Leptothoe sp. PORK10 BA2]|uniref:Mrp/NBP35 family ATP-binding protein n=1 Tax=Leptothoe sp. PORK10 BA2 TaxID=3110254 RepID=UPI002B202AD6|nr:Mrp/NBP35 family ATP-binding protein [Leptothoe sp. PORK10 BA2]MEA5466797.1 Mrp/NBP35 family ATP-binding protein [Leptothoe sp. PORK10 BA2]
MPNHESPFIRQSFKTANTADGSSETSLAAAARKQAAIACLKKVIEPNLNNNIVDLGMVRNLRVVDNYVYFRLYVGVHQQDLKNQAQCSLANLGWCKKAYIQICTIPGVRTTLAVSSGKGGVGKSTTAVNLAAALTKTGAKVGVLDADIYGPNVPQMMGLGHADVEIVKTAQGDRFKPLEAYGIKVMSVGLLAAPEHPLAWRGPVLHKIITQFIQEVDWGDLDYLLIDLPPGTGDAQITIIQESPICGVVMVTTPQQVAVSDVRRSIHMFRQVGVPVLGLVENMSYLICGCCGDRTSIFGTGGGMQMAAELSVPLLGQVPIDPNICAGGDSGQPLPLADEAAPLSRVFETIAQGLNNTFAPSLKSVSAALR